MITPIDGCHKGVKKRTRRQTEKYPGLHWNSESKGIDIDNPQNKKMVSTSLLSSNTNIDFFYYATLSKARDAPSSAPRRTMRMILRQPPERDGPTASLGSIGEYSSNRTIKSTCVSSIRRQQYRVNDNASSASLQGKNNHVSKSGK